MQRQKASYGVTNSVIFPNFHIFQMLMSCINAWLQFSIVQGRFELPEAVISLLTFTNQDDAAATVPWNLTALPSH